jgi:hypothetical protein
VDSFPVPERWPHKIEIFIGIKKSFSKIKVKRVKTGRVVSPGLVHFLKLNLRLG